MEHTQEMIREPQGEVSCALWQVVRSFLKLGTGVTPRDQTAHQIKNVVDLSKRIPKEKSDERKSSQQRIEDDSSASAG